MKPLRLVFLGTAGYYPTEERRTSSIMLPEFGIVLDAGGGFFRVPNYLQTQKLHILFSHCHLDHVAGVNYLFGFGERIQEVNFYGPSPIIKTVNTLMGEQFFPSPPIERPFSTKTFQFSQKQGEFSLVCGGSKVEISFQKFDHPSQKVIGWRLVLEGQSIVYLTDKTVFHNDTALSFAHGANLLIHECVFEAENKEEAIKTGHSYSLGVGEFAKKAMVGELVLTHLTMESFQSPEKILEEVKTVFPRTLLAYDKMDLDI